MSADDEERATRQSRREYGWATRIDDRDHLAASEREAWLEQRRHYVGASDVAAIMGESPWKCARDVWAEKRGEAIEHDEATRRRMSRGTHAEAAVLGMWRDRGHDVRPLGKIVVDEVEPHLGVTPDALEIVDGDSMLVEVKTTSQSVNDWAGEAPLYYQLQLQAQLAATGHPRGAILCWHLGDDELVPYESERHEPAIAKIRAAVRDFWAMVESGTPPPLVGLPSEWDHVKRKHPRDNGATIELDADALRIADELDRVSREANALYDRKRGLQAQLCERIGDASFATLPDGTRYSWRTQKRRAYAVNESESRVLRRLKSEAR